MRETQISIIQFKEIKKPAISTADCRVCYTVRRVIQQEISIPTLIIVLKVD